MASFRAVHRPAPRTLPNGALHWRSGGVRRGVRRSGTGFGSVFQAAAVRGASPEPVRRAMSASSASARSAPSVGGATSIAQSG